MRRVGRRQGACCGQGMQAVACELVGRDVVADVAGLGGLREQVAEHGVQVVLCFGEVFAGVQKRRQFGAVRLMQVVLSPLVLDQRVGVQHLLEAFAGVALPVADLPELCQVAADPAFVPGGQDRLDVREVLVQGRPPDAGLRGDLRHLHAGQPVFGHQRRRGVQGRVAHRLPVRVDRLVPELRHVPEHT